MELMIERVGDELRIRPVQRRMGNVMQALARFSPDFMSGGRGDQEQAKREPL
jgi:antitoxin VapB